MEEGKVQSGLGKEMTMITGFFILSCFINAKY